MPAFNIEVPHQLGQQEAADRLRGFFQKVREKYQSQVTDLEENWDDNQLSFSFKTYGFVIKGTGTVLVENVQFAGELPFAAVAFRGKIEQSIREELVKELS